METGYLNKYFSGVVVKRLSEVEANIESSNQHEFNGNKAMCQMLGEDIPRKEFDVLFLYMEDKFTRDAAGKMTWYDSRYRNPQRTEWRFYFPTTEVSKCANAGDSLFICKKTDDTLLIIIAKKDSTIENQLYWLFDLSRQGTGKFIGKTEFNNGNKQIEFVVRMILEQIGVEYEDPGIESYLEPMLIQFQGKFPTTKEFSAYARNTITDVDPIGNPDDTLLKWVNREEALFRLLEQYLIKEQIRVGFQIGEDVDVDGFIQFSLSVQNRRKSRAGLSLENHVEALLKEHNIVYSHTPVTEDKSKPDFIFPNIEMYRNKTYPENKLTMLGVKSTCKDRWRQVLSEAERIKHKHLLTLESAISENQTNEMISKKLQLVLPWQIHETYTSKQQTWLYTVQMFLDEVKEKQKFYEGNRR
ncbi:restriction endonuclease [Clostridiaceae bacterium AF29-16BH]|nr:restriction endonuclease [Clostridiaceae bacterium AF29-16BH]